MKIVFTKDALSQYNYWKDNDDKISLKIKLLLEQIQVSPFRGIGNPEALKHDLKGFWSRRINRQHRLVYKIEGSKPNQVITVIQCKFHY